MGINLADLFSIEKEEKGLITTLLIQSVFLGIFYGVLNITAHSLFLAKFDETIMARAYILSGLVGSGLTYIYTLFQSRMKFMGFSIINLIFVLLVTVGLWLMMVLQPGNMIIFIIFIMLGPLNILAMLGFWGTASRMFTLRQGKRLFGIIDTGLVVGIIISSFGIPVLLSININTRDMLLLSCISILVAVIIQAVISKNYKDLIRTTSDSKESKAGIAVFGKDKYIRSMGLFIALSMVVLFFIQYSFMAVTRARYPEEADLARFLGFFEGSMMIFTLLIKTFIFSYLIKNHGLKVTLVVAPILIGILTIVAIIIGATSDFTIGATGFMLFFLILAVSRLFSFSMKTSVETPAFKVLYQTLKERLRYSVQSAIDGTVNEIAALFSGLILSGLGALAFIKLIHFSWVLFALILIWVLYAIKLYNEYRNSVRKSLESKDESKEKDDAVHDIMYSPSASAIRLINNYYDIISVSDRIEGLETKKTLLDTILTRAKGSMNPDLLPRLKSVQDLLGKEHPHYESFKKVIREIEKVSLDLSSKGTGNLMDELEKTSDKRTLLRSLFSSNYQPVITDLLRLIRDHDIEIKRETLYFIGKHKVKELLPEVADCLDIDDLLKDAYQVLRQFKDEAFEALSGHFFRSSGNINARRLIIRLFGESGGPEAVEFLLQRLLSVQKSLRKEAVQGLLNCGYVADEEVKVRLLQEVNDIIGLVTWNIGASITLKANDDLRLSMIMAKETQWWFNFLFDLLSLIYEKSSFDKIRENLESETVEAVNFALEMLDLVVDEEIKPKLNALLDVIPDEQKIKNLFQFYPGDIPDYRDMIEDLINKDYNHIPIWTKVCALRSL